MQIRPSEEQVLLRDMIRRFLADRVPASDIGQGPMGTAEWQEMGNLGLLAVALTELAGGMSGTPQDAAIVAEELGRAFAITPFSESILGAIDLLARCSDQSAVQDLVKAGASGSAVVSLAEGQVSEAPDGLTGTCHCVRWGGQAGSFVLVDGARAWLLLGNAPGLSRQTMRLADGSIAATLLLEGCPVTALPVSPDDVSRARGMAQLGYVAEMVGAMATLLEQTNDYARQRQQFGVPIGSFQVVQHKLARMFIKLEQSRSLLLKAALTDLGSYDFLRNLTAAKAYIAEAAQKVAEEAVQLHGGMGVTDELPVGRALRRIMVLARLFGRADEARQALAA